MAGKPEIQNLDVYLRSIEQRPRLRLGRAAREPRWRLGTTLPHGALEAGVAAWLHDADSLTKRLRQACPGRFRVALLGQRWARPMRCERRLLGLDDRALALVRQVHLYCGDEVVVFARTVLPASLLGSRYRYLARLGGKPLGEVLFRDRSMRRSEVELARIEARRSIYAPLLPQRGDGVIWGRRSLFRLGGQPLLVSELFVPPLPHLPSHRFRVTRKSGR